jgi:hypothetical protein
MKKEFTVTGKEVLGMSLLTNVLLQEYHRKNYKVIELNESAAEVKEWKLQK